jgi:hypothetical protein
VTNMMQSGIKTMAAPTIPVIADTVRIVKGYTGRY